MRQLVHEMHRRSLWQVLGICAVASGHLPGGRRALEGIGFPSWVPGTALVLLLIGLPIVLATASALAELGLAWDAAGRPDSALAAYERYLETPWATRTGIGGAWGDNYFLATVHGRMGVLHDMRGADTAAARHYARFVDLWDEADPELQPRVDAAWRALTRLTGEGGG